MRFPRPAGTFLLALAGAACAAPASSATTSMTTSSTVTSTPRPLTLALDAVSSMVADPSCTNTPDTRACWDDGFSATTDFDQTHPDTGVVKRYHLTIAEAMCNPDGNWQKQCLLVNGQFTGPVIRAGWGDTLEISVTNKMKDNGTSIHWHGIRQLNSVGSDGVGGLTECPIAPGFTKTYRFICSQYGTSWYHSHHSSQYGQGIVGAIQIEGPASANYDVDLGVFPVSDWFYQGPWVLNEQALANLQLQKAPPTANNILINGTGSVNGKGSNARVQLQNGRRHRLRLINTSVDNFIRVKLDGHKFTLIAADFVPIVPQKEQDWVLLGIGQRYDVVFTANRTAGNYWFRAEAAADCFSGNDGHGRALFTYSGQVPSPPPDSNEVPPGNGCAELVTAPYWPQSVSEDDYLTQVKSLSTVFTGTLVDPGLKTSADQTLVLWALNSTSMNIQWDKPTLQYVMDGNTSYPSYADVIEIPSSREGGWTYWVTQALGTAEQKPPGAIAPPAIPHPIHLHGHDFFVLGAGPGKYDGTTNGLNFANPPRRDTAFLPAGGWLAIAFQANNPGSWLMHCHIAIHISEGLGVQFLEAKEKIVLPDVGQFRNQCSAWKSYYATAPFKKVDSGL